MTKTMAYRIYECPKKPTEYGKFIGQVQILEQAKRACKLAKEKRNKDYFIKALKDDGTEVILL
jgi:hypothetical protein